MDRGLCDKDIESLREKFGYNEVLQKKTPVAFLFLKHFSGLTAYMLEATIIISFLLNKNFDGWIITALLFFNAIIGFYNELKSGKTVAALQQKLQVVVRVLRNGEWKQLPSRELLPGDVLRIRTGDFLTADMQVLEGSVMADKSALTGETTLIECSTGEILFAGSVTKSGECTTRVTHTGLNTFFGKTASLVHTAKHKMHMETVVIKVVRVLFVSVIGILSLTTIVGLLNGQNIVSILPLILILLVSAVPVGLPAMFTISMARGSKELAEYGLLITRLSATEDAATLTTLCIDKTGTITKNELSLQQIQCNDGYSQEDLLLLGSLASVKEDNDAIDMAFFREAEKRKVNFSRYIQKSFTPFNSETKRTEAEITTSDGEMLSITKGAFNTIKNICDVTDTSIDETVIGWAQKGYKTIAIAVRKNGKWKMAGIAALYDAPWDDAKDILTQLKNSGLTIKMLTGDALPIGKQIAEEVGIGDKVVSIVDVRESDGGFSSDTIHVYDGFAEVLPADKFNMVKAFQKENKIVGMTGDGVNDAPALKQAEVGIAVKSATDVAKQSASIILLKDGLQQMLDLIKVGRGIHIRIVNYTVNKIAKTIQTILFVCVAFILTKQFVVSPLDMIIMLFLIDFAVLSLSVDKVSVSNQPADWNIRPLVKKGVLLGLLLFAECFIWFFVAKDLFGITDEEELHSLGFACLFYSSLLVIPVIRTDKRFYQQPISKTLLLVIIADAALVVGLLSMGITEFKPLNATIAVITIVYFLFCNLVINDNLKIIFTKQEKR